MYSMQGVPTAGSCVGDYILTRRLGEGASGVVFAGNDIRGKSVALKFFPSAVYSTYNQEVMCMEKFPGSQHIINIIEHFRWGSFHVIVMEKLSSDLLDLIEIGLETKEVKRIFKQICSGVKILHESNIAHRDLKPENILLDDDDCAKIADFGAAIESDGPYVNERICFGTVIYSAPEIATKFVYDPKKADIWSLGIVLHVMFTGVWPYQAKSQESLIQSLTSGVCNVHIYKQHMPDDNHLIQLISSMLDIEPSNRPTIEEVLESSWFGKNKPIPCMRTKNTQPKKKFSPARKIANFIQQIIK